jgi:hypothetical protein
MAQSQTHTTARFNGVKVFSATMAQERENLGEKVTSWIREHPQCQVVDTIVTQSSDEAFHCLAIPSSTWKTGRRSRLLPGPTGRWAEGGRSESVLRRGCLSADENKRVADLAAALLRLGERPS